MICPKCGCANVNIQAVTEVKSKGHGCLYWLFIGWWLEILLWIFFTIPMMFFKLFGGKKVKSKLRSYAVCQNCGYSWRI